jgi:5-methylcytosine-specific restriction endonuclease McrA
MPYKNKPRPYKKEYQQQKARGEQPKRNARERARYAMDKAGVDRKGKDIDHVVPLSKGGSNARSNLKLKSPSANRSFSRNSDHTVKRNKPKNANS